MTISKTNKRVIITIPQKIYEEISKLAQNDNRSVSNYIVTLLVDHVDEKSNLSGQSLKQ